MVARGAAINQANASVAAAAGQHERRGSSGTSHANEHGGGSPSKQMKDKPLWPAEMHGDTDFERYRSFCWQLFEAPEENLVSQSINMFILVLIVASAIVTVVETIPGYHRKNTEMWYGLECFFVVNFSIELVGRLCSCPNYKAFFTSGMNYIDIVSILPFYVDLLVGSGGANLSVLRVLRLGRSLRLVKLSRYSRGIRLVTNAMEQSVDALQLFFFLLTIVLVVCSSAIYYTERGTYNEDTGYWERKHPLTGRTDRSPFQSIPQSFWWCIVTLTTVGYGDTYPVTYQGQAVGTITMLLGLVMLALPLSIIGTNFIEERANMIKEMEQDEAGDVVEEAQSLKAQLEETIDVINEVVKYQELIAESMGDAIKIIASCKAEQSKRTGGDPLANASKSRRVTTNSSAQVAPEESDGATAQVTASTPSMGSAHVEHSLPGTPVGNMSGATTTNAEGSTGVGTGAGTGVGAGVGSDGSDNLEAVPGEDSTEVEKVLPHEKRASTGLPGGVGDEDLVPLDAAVVSVLEVLCKNVIKSCTNTEKAIL